MDETSSAPGHATQGSASAPAYGTGDAAPEATWRRSWWSTIAWEWVLIWTVAVAALAIVAVVTVLLFMGLLEMIEVISPVIVAILLVWAAFLTYRTLQLEKQVKALQERS